jgi:hypothetical protein
MDEDRTRQAQVWWTLGVGIVLAVMALQQASPPVEARSLRGPAQLSAPRKSGVELREFRAHSSQGLHHPSSRFKQ